MMGIGFIWMLLFWGALILLSVWLISALFPKSAQLPGEPSPPPPSSASSALEILRQRYARGELSTEQYHEMRQTLEQ
jgi:putative membrane protein